nr:helix-turn-helix domain-containing protein [uncultured Chryseobacterium sp.]
MNQPSDHFPVLGIQDFNENEETAGHLLFNELHGERSIEIPHKHDFFIINLFGIGKGSHHIDFVLHQIKNHQIHLVFPGQVHHWDIKKETVGCQLMISRNWFESLLPHLRFSASFFRNYPVINFSEDAFQSVLYEFRSVRNELKSENIFWEMIRKRCEVIALIISKSVEESMDQQAFHSNPVVSRFINLIDLHFRDERSVSFYAAQLHLSSNYLNIICKKSLSVSASSLIQNRILLEAKRLLKVSEMSVKDIVYDLGFYDHASFSKFFRLHTGMTPSQFKVSI